MNTGWIAYVLLTGAIVAVAVLAVDAACRLAGWPRRWAPFGGLLMIIALAVIAPENAREAAPAIQFDAPSIPVTEITELVPAAAAPVARPLSDALRTVTNAAQTLPQLVAAIFPRRFEPFYIGAWGAASAILFLLFLLVHVRFLSARRGWPILNLFGTMVRLSPAAGPAVVGAFRPDIVIPKWLLQREREQQLLVLAHEREHVRSRDPLMLASAWTCALLMPWHPAVWWMLWRLRLAVELDCDARVLSHGAPRRSYGALLIELSQQSSGLPVGATALSDRTTHLERRLLAMNTHRPSFFRLRSTACALIAIVMILSACALRKPASSAEEPAAGKTPAPVTEATGAPSPLVQRFIEPLIIIDGVIQMRDDPTLGRTPPAATPPNSPPTTPPRSPNPVIVFDGVIQMPPPVPATDTGVRTPPLPTPFTRPLIIIDGVIQMADDPTLGRTPPIPRTDTASRSVPPVPPVRPRVDTLLTAAQQLGRLLIIVDGVIIFSDTVSVFRNLTGDQIESVEVIRGAAAAALYGARAQNGVLNVRTKAFQATMPVGGRVGGGRAGGRGSGDSSFVRTGSDVVVQIRNPLSVTGFTQPMIILDGVIQMDSTGAPASGDLINRIDPSRIASIEVVRGAAAVALYGQRAANGVINITTKKR